MKSKYEKRQEALARQKAQVLKLVAEYQQQRDYEAKRKRSRDEPSFVDAKLRSVFWAVKTLRNIGGKVDSFDVWNFIGSLPKDIRTAVE